MMPSILLAACPAGAPAEVTSLFWLVIAVMIFAIALLYMAAMFFHKPEYEALSTIELWQVGVSAVIMLSIFGVACFVEEVSVAIAGANSFDISQEYLNKIIYSDDDDDDGNGFVGAFQLVQQLEFFKLKWQYWGNIYGKYGAGAWGIRIPIFPGAIAFEKSYDFLIIFLSPFTSSLMAQQIGLQFIRGTMLSLVLPVGVLLRAVPFTRDAGAFLIAFALGFYIIFPFTYVMHSQVMTYLISHQASLFNVGELFDTEVHATAPTPANPNPPPVNLRTQTELINTLSYNTFFDWNASMFLLLRSLSFVIFQAVFLPSLSMVITVTFIKSILKFFSQKLE
jgi:hypothetical protein